VKEIGGLIRQYQNNTTKALINVLENSSFETQKHIIESISGIEIPKNIEKINYILQSSSFSKERINDLSNKSILAISPHGEVKDIKVKYITKSTPDAWIWSSKFVILFENKTNGELNKAQLKQHEKLLGGKCKLIVKSWIDDIYPNIKSIQPKLDNEKDRFLLLEFKKYLEVIGLSGFEGFEKEDFMRRYCNDDEKEEFEYLKPAFPTFGYN